MEEEIETDEEEFIPDYEPEEFKLNNKQELRESIE